MLKYFRTLYIAIALAATLNIAALVYIYNFCLRLDADASSIKEQVLHSATYCSMQDDKIISLVEQKPVLLSASDTIIPCYEEILGKAALIIVALFISLVLLFILFIIVLHASTEFKQLFNFDYNVPSSMH